MTHLIIILKRLVSLTVLADKNFNTSEIENYVETFTVTFVQMTVHRDIKMFNLTFEFSTLFSNCIAMLLNMLATKPAPKLHVKVDVGLNTMN